jgi:hypothetical protein
MAAAPDTNADYLVRRTSYVPGMPAIEAECGATAPVTQCFPDDSLSTATSLSGSVSNGGYYSASSTNLATGELRIEGNGPTYQALASAELQDELTFTNITPGTVQTIGVIINLDGTYRDGTVINVSSSFFSGGYGTAGDYLSLDLSFMGNGEATNPGNPVSTTIFSLLDTCAECTAGGSGDWSLFGPGQFIGAVDIYGDDPVMNLYMGINGTGYFDLGNTASVLLALPEGVGFTSSSGVFLSAVPVPGAIWLFGSGLLGLVWMSRRKKPCQQFQI